MKIFVAGTDTVAILKSCAKEKRIIVRDRRNPKLKLQTSKPSPNYLIMNSCSIGIFIIFTILVFRCCCLILTPHKFG